MALFGENNGGGASTKVEKYLKWKGASDTGFFAFYDKEAGAETTFKVSELIVLKVGYNIQGWSDAKNTRMYSNQIEKFDEELNVKAGDDTLYTGLYRDLKGDIVTEGGKLHIVLTCIHEGEIVQLSLKGGAYAKMSDLLKEVNTNTNKLAFDKFEEGKKGAVKFRTPLFKEGSELSTDEVKEATEAAQGLKYKPAPQEAAMAEAEAGINVEDIPF